MEVSLVLFKISTLITAVTSFVVGIFVFSKRNKSRETLLWSLTVISVAVWSSGLYKVITSTSQEEGIYWNKLLYFGAILVPPFFYHFTVEFFRLSQKNKNKIVIFYVLALVFLLFNFTSRSFIKSADSFAHFDYWVAGGFVYYYFYVPYFFFLIILAFYNLFTNYKKVPGLKRIQAKYIIISSLIGFIGGSSNFLPQIVGIYPVGNYFIFLYLILATYAIARHRLFGIRFLASKLYFYFFVTSFFLLYLYLAYLLEGIFVRETGGLFFPLVSFPLAIVFAILSIPLFSYLQRSSDIIFYNGKNPATVIKKLAIKLSSVSNPIQLIELAQQELKKVLKSKEVKIILSAEKKKLSSNSFYQELLGAKQTLVQNEISDENLDIKNKLKKNGIEIVMSIKSNKDVLGIMIVDQKKGEEAYTKEEIDLIAVIVHQLAIELQKAELSNQVNETKERFSALRWERK